MNRLAHPAVRAALLAALTLAGTKNAAATFHEMQIEQVMGGYCGAVDQQAVQLRLRAPGENMVSGKRLVAYDAAGQNGVTLATLPSNVTNAAQGDHILVATASFASEQGIVPDFTLTTAIPPAYLEAGRITWEDGLGTVYWSLAWGGTAYTGSTTGSTFNDADGDFGPPFGGVVPTSTGQVLRFQGAAGALSTSNSLDYAVDAGDATFVNNARASAQVVPGCVFGDGFETGVASRWSVVSP